MKDRFASREPEPTVRSVRIAAMDLGHDTDHVAVDVTGTVRRIEGKRLVRRHQDTDDVSLIGVQRKRARKTRVFQIFARRIDQPILVADFIFILQNETSFP